MIDPCREGGGCNAVDASLEHNPSPQASAAASLLHQVNGNLQLLLNQDSVNLRGTSLSQIYDIT